MRNLCVTFISSLPDLAWLTIIIVSIMSASGRSRGSIVRGPIAIKNVVGLNKRFSC